MIRIIAISLFISLLMLGFTKTSAQAETQAACSIWLCLPGGFPTGCAAAYAEFKNRIKHGHAPLPDLASCTVNQNGNHSNGRYEQGMDYYMPCKSGFAIENGVCKPTNQLCMMNEEFRRGDKIDCTIYTATPRPQPRFIKIWVDDKYLGQFFY